MNDKPLTGRQLLFVGEYIKNGGNAFKAAEAAGYKAPQVEGSRLLENVRIRERIKAAQKDVQALFAAEVENSIRTIMHLRDKARNESVRLKASQDLLDRAGYKPTEKVQADVTQDTEMRVVFSIPRPKHDDAEG